MKSACGSSDALVSPQRWNSTVLLIAVAQIVRQRVARATAGVCACAGVESRAAMARTRGLSFRMGFSRDWRQSSQLLARSYRGKVGDSPLLPFRSPPMRRLALYTAVALSLSFAAQANEGMWVPQQLPEIAGPLKQAGLKLDTKHLADLTGQPMGAVVAINGCTASFVSPQGLIATNHHCAYGSIQLNSSPTRNLIRDGFNAAQLSDELTGGPNARVYVMDQISDVTHHG